MPRSGRRSRRSWARRSGGTARWKRCSTVSSSPLASRLARIFTASGRQQIRERLYAWWWWRSVNRPHVVDETYLRLLDQLPAEARGLDLGSRSRIRKTLKPGALAFIQAPFLENVDGWPADYYRFTLRGLRVLFSDLDEVASGVSAGPGQVLPDPVQYYSVGFAELQKGGLLVNLCCLIPGFLLIPIRMLDRLLKDRPS